MPAPYEQTLEENLWLLPPATQRALREASNQPEVVIQRGEGTIKASIRNSDGQLVPIQGPTDPASAASKININGEAPPLVIVVGLGLGYLLDQIEQKHQGTRVLAIEPIPSLTRAMLSRRDWDGWLQTGRLTLLVGPDYADTGIVPKLLARTQRMPAIILSPLLQREFPDETAGATVLLRKILGNLPSAQRQAS